MTDTPAKESQGPKRDRSPAFPYIGLAKALQRIEVLFAKVKRYEARVADIASDWGLSPKSSSTDRTIAALQAYGLVEDAGSGDARKIKVSDLGWRILDDGRPGVREKLLAEAALRPRIIADYALRWQGGRPDDTHALSQLKFEGGFTDDGARIFLRVFDETIRFVQASEGDKPPEIMADEDRQQSQEQLDNAPEKSTPPPQGRQATGKPVLLEGERELTTGILSKGASFRLIVSGKIGPTEIERLIKKLELDKEILAEQADDGEAGI